MVALVARLAAFLGARRLGLRGRCGPRLAPALQNLFRAGAYELQLRQANRLHRPMIPPGLFGEEPILCNATTIATAFYVEMKGVFGDGPIRRR